MTVDWHKKQLHSQNKICYDRTQQISNKALPINEHPETELSFLLTFRFSKIERPLEKDRKCTV